MAYPSTQAQVITEVRALLNEPSPAFFTDTELTNWIKQATVDISTKAGCIESITSLPLVSSSLTYDLSSHTAFSSVTVAKIHNVIHINGSSGAAAGLIKITPTMLKHETFSTNGEPKYWYQYGDYLGIYPLTSSTESARGDTVSVYYGKVSDTVTDLPDEYTPLSVDYTVSQALAKKRKNAQSAQFYTKYINALRFQREDLQERSRDSHGDLKIPDATQVVRQ